MEKNFFRKSYQPTYEELKPNTTLGGNTNEKELPAYLWGIETQY